MESYTYLGIYLGIGYLIALVLWAWVVSWAPSASGRDLLMCVVLGISWVFCIPVLLLIGPFVYILLRKRRVDR